MSEKACAEETSVLQAESVSYGGLVAALLVSVVVMGATILHGELRRRRKRG